MSELFEKASGLAKVKLMKGVPVVYKEGTYYAPVLYIQETTGEKLNSAKKDPRVKTKNGFNEEKLASLFLASSLIVKACDLITEETAIKRLKGFDTGEEEEVEKLLKAKVFPDSKDAWVLTLENVEDERIILGDSKRLGLAFRAVNRLQEEELQSFLDF